MLLGGAGRIAGCSGIFRKLLTLHITEDWTWRAIFIVGLLAGGWLAGLYAPNAQGLSFASTGFNIVGGVLVGLGTALANGCTSGHGICGLARFSPRSLVAVITFMAFAIITVFITRHVWGV